MRAGLLSSPPVIKALKENFVCTWALPGVIRDLQENAPSAPNREFADTLIKDFRPLVEIFILTPDGKVVSRHAMNEDLLGPYPNHWPPDEALLKFYLDHLAESAKTASGL